MELSKEQQKAFDKYKQGQNLFITGPGGSGKSALIKKIYQHAQYFKYIQVCALTGCAAVLLNCKARTLHSWAGIGLGNGSIQNLILKIKNNKFAKEMWKTTDILVVDEVSMLSLKLFEILNEIGKAIRSNSKPFGGIQLIFSGDFYQLPPVGNKDEKETQMFCFESIEWNNVFPLDSQIQLVKIFRQKDETYANILNQIREGKIKKSVNNLLEEYVGREINNNLIIEPTKLFPTKNKVENINISNLHILQGDLVSFKIKFMYEIEMTKNERKIRSEFSDKEIETELQFLSSNLLCDTNIQLKVGAQVMSVINIQSDNNIEICNGSQGIITCFCEVTGCPRVRFNNGVERIMTYHTWASEKIPGIGVAQVPLILAWALTIHKSQGATLDAAEIDVGSGIFECGQTYVALSRVKSLEGLYLTSFDAKRIKINKKVKDFYDYLSEYHDKSNNDSELQMVFLEPINQNENIFDEYQYVEPKNVELSDEDYDN
jgi:ATP-dependent DNA helicase PIF1